MKLKMVGGFFSITPIRSKDNSTRIVTFLLYFLFVFSLFSLFAQSANATMYEPGITLEPDCPPTDLSTCGVLTFNLNGLASTTQSFATGTGGTDFNIVSVSGIHTFNIPTASSVNRGLLSTLDWINFNNKVSTSSLASNLAGYLTTLSAVNTYLPLSASTSLAYIPSASSSLYLLNSASTSLAYVKSESDPVWMAASSSYLTTQAATDILASYLSTTSAAGTYLSQASASTNYAQLSGATFTGAVLASNLSTTNTGDVTLANDTNGLTISNQVLTLGLSGASSVGSLSAIDWNIFNNKLRLL